MNILKCILFAPPPAHISHMVPDKQYFFNVKLQLSSFPSEFTCDLGAQKNRLIEMVYFENPQHMFHL